MKRAIRVKAVPTAALPPNFQPKGHSDYPATCPGCQLKGVWGWDPRVNKPMILEVHRGGYASMHHCRTPQTEDIFPGWCEKCKAPELLWMRKQEGFELSETYGLPHLCEQDPMQAIQDMSKGRCRFCKTDNLLWVKKQAKFTLVDYNGVRHDCGGYGQMSLAWKEAKRMNYAFEKAWLNSIPDGTACKRCKGLKHVKFLSKAKKILQKYNTTDPVPMIRPCLHCKRIGVFSPENKKSYLKDLRKRYWPFRGGVHKWARYDKVDGY